VAIRPEAGQKPHAGFQRHVDRQASRYAEQLAHATQLADRFECGDVIGVFSTQTGGDIRPRAYVVGLLPMTAIPVLIAGAQVGEVWTDVCNISAEESRPALTAYRLRWADGQTQEIPRSFQNVSDPYPDVGPLLKSMLPASVGQAMPAFPTIGEIIAAYAGKLFPRA
jgi:hypothetical protein